MLCEPCSNAAPILSQVSGNGGVIGNNDGVRLQRAWYHDLDMLLELLTRTLSSQSHDSCHKVFGRGGGASHDEMLLSLLQLVLLLLLLLLPRLVSDLSQENGTGPSCKAHLGSTQTAKPL